MVFMIKRIKRTLRFLFKRDAVERELNNELSFHLQMESEKNAKSGMPANQASRKAVRDFGGIDKTKEEWRDAARGHLIEQFLQDIRFGYRMLRRSPVFTLAAVLTLALGIGANSAIFSVIYGVLLKSLPYRDGDRLVLIHQDAPRVHVEDMGFSVKEIADYREQNHTLDSIVEHHSMSFILYGRKEAERVQTSVVSANFFDVLGVKPLLGRTFVAADDQPGADAVLVLSYDYWQRSFGGDKNIVGQMFQMNNRPHRVIGVLPSIPEYPVKSDVYMPTSACPTRSSAAFIANRNSRMMNAFGRLKPGVTLAQAQADLSTVASNLEKEYPASYPSSAGYAARVGSLREELTERARPTFLLLLATAGFVLLIACANVANLLLARLARRERELAVRVALGASRGRMIRQLLTESTMLSLVGGAAGLLLASGVLSLLVAFAAKLTNRSEEITINGWVLLFTLALSLVTGLLFGLAPALSSQRYIATAIKEGSVRGANAGPRHHWIRSALIVGQVAVSFVLLIGAGLMLRSLLNLQRINPGFNPEKVLVMRISLNWTKYDTNEKVRQIRQRIYDAVRTQPGIKSAALASTFPMNPAGITFGPFNQGFTIEGEAKNPNAPMPVADVRVATPSYFETLEIPLIKGRTFQDSDNQDVPQVAVINQSMARHRFENQNPIGKRISLDDDGMNSEPTNEEKKWATIIGIVGDIQQYGLDRNPTDELYFAEAQSPGSGIVLVRTQSDPMAVASIVRDSIHKIDAETAIDRVETLDQAKSDSISTPRLTSYLLALFAGLALLITITGIVGVMALSVSQRTHEMGIRLALGASASQIIAMVVRNGMALVALGLGIGLIGSLAATRLLSALLFKVEPTDPLTFAAVALVFLAAATTACLIPARKVTVIDPMQSLRFE